jgi:hypothetical protein
VRRVEQSRGYDGNGGGDCVAACLATIFEIPLDEVGIADGPSATELADWTRRRYPWLECREQDHGKDYREVEGGLWTYDIPEESPAPLTGGIWMASVVSPSGLLRHGPYAGSPVLHCVVMRGRQCAWDPSPSRDECFGVVVLQTWWVARDPARCVESPGHRRGR